MALAAWLGGAAGCLEADFASLDIDADGRVPQFGLRHSASVPTAHHAPPRSQDVRIIYTAQARRHRDQTLRSRSVPRLKGRLTAPTAQQTDTAAAGRRLVSGDELASQLPALLAAAAPVGGLTPIAGALRCPSPIYGPFLPVPPVPVRAVCGRSRGAHSHTSSASRSDDHRQRDVPPAPGAHAAPSRLHSCRSEPRAMPHLQRRPAPSSGASSSRSTSSR